MKEVKIVLHPFHLSSLIRGEELKAFSKSGEWLFTITPPAAHGEQTMAEVDVEES